MSAADYAPLIIPATILACAVVARVGSDLATQAEARKASRVARIESAVGRLAADIAHDLITAPPAADVFADVKSVAVSEAASHLSELMPKTLPRAGVTPDALVKMLSGEVSRQTLQAAAPALLGAAAAAIMAPLADAPTAAGVG